jgi:hypothetical protein|tara:strand:- start:418 stop:639 length:222 start_codon:yes stop_codon:yes gene_type:complete
LKLVVVVLVLKDLHLHPEELRGGKVILVHHLNKLKCLLLAVVAVELTMALDLVDQEDLVEVAVVADQVLAEPQ